MFENYEFRQLRLNNAQQKELVTQFLADNGLAIEPMDYYLGIFDDDTLLAGGGVYKNIIKCIAVASFARELSLTNTLITQLHNYVREKGYYNTFLFTKRIYEKVFSSLAFYPIGHSPDAVLLESKYGGIKSYCHKLTANRKEGTSGCIIMNCNPMTNGHLYLITTASAMVDNLHIFVVSEEQPFMPAVDRYNLVKQCTAHLPNVTVHNGSEYMISQATFPSYFIKDASKVARNQILLDLDIFANYIAPALNIKVRFVGSEPTDMATKQYNELMQSTLPDKGIAVKQIDRIDYNGQPISASKVRSYYDESKFELIDTVVPKPVYEYLLHKKNG